MWIGILSQALKDEVCSCVLIPTEFDLDDNGSAQNTLILKSVWIILDWAQSNFRSTLDLTCVFEIILILGNLRM